MRSSATDVAEAQIKRCHCLGDVDASRPYTIAYYATDSSGLMQSE